MPDYRKMYFALAAKVADAIELLIEAQQSGEDEAIDDNPCLISLPHDAKETKDG